MQLEHRLTNKPPHLTRRLLDSHSRPNRDLLIHTPNLMPDRNLTGLVLTRSERILVVALSYLYVAPLIFNRGKKILAFLRGTSLAAEERLRRAAERRERAERILRDYQEHLERTGEAAERERQYE
jgi:hypothetical protein